MSEDRRALATSLIEAILEDELTASNFAQAAWRIEAARSSRDAEATRWLARYHRVKALENRGRLAALGTETGWDFFNTVKPGP
ncbi:hypothetical protein [Methylobacterium oxalidis]|uniref:Uncharacterized protein n=1 Tax=Methylobacterium oxalidis TaxID=944322 RepID=A0A512J9M0_9HYPH|nr:hypothetical protein [Methylobacterium oxalidis]GEP06615.1 hypothetical protein MOX02_46530 [Methylobacterium oxalidis]GJE35403.1 hypothetical protein LDDCCGHA_5621 [Methylobacterium oxalidis]GLS66229.1 hypothetical protein GCM10007888_46110 [Methylobacterium oxalidis]